MDALARSKPHSKRNLAPLGRNLALQAAFQVQLGASWARFSVLLRPSDLSSRLHGSYILGFFLFLYFKAGFGAQLGAHRGALRPHLVVLGHLLGSTWRLLGSTWLLLASIWSLLGASWGQLGASWAQFGTSWCQLLSSWDDPGSFLMLFALQVASKWSPSVLQVASKWPPSVSKSLPALSKAFERFIQACCSASGCA